MACNTVEELETYLSETTEVISANKYVRFCRSQKESVEAFAGTNTEDLFEGEGGSLWYSHFSWLDMMGIYKPEEEE
jgi:hypothetical protein